MITEPEQVDHELLSLLWDLYEQMCVDLRAFKDHPAHDAVRARLCAQRLGLALESLELMHVTNVFTQPGWVADEESISELYGLLTARQHPELRL